MNEFEKMAESLIKIKDSVLSSSIKREQYFMAISIITARRSKDPSRKVGACIVKNNKIIGTGYNGFPNGLPDDEYPWTKDSDNELENKYMYVVHAEANAILNSNRDTQDSTIYVTSSPCNECAKLIIQAGIKKVIYLKKYKPESNSYIATSRMFKSAGVEMICYDDIT